jgi:hydroxypyruvate isomerase
MMNPIRQSFAWWCVSPQVRDPARFFEAARQIGYQGVELLPRELWDVALASGLVITSEGVGSLTQGLNRLEHHAEIEAEFQQKLELAVQYHIPNLIVFSGNRAGLSDEAGLLNTVQGLQRLAPAAEAHGIKLVLELLNSKIDHPDYQCDHTVWGTQVIDQVNSPAVKLLYDIYHMQIMEGDVIRTLQTHIARIAHVHTAGNPGRHDLDQDQELNYPAILRALKQTGYTGFVTQEFVPKGDALEALRTAYHLCNV